MNRLTHVFYELKRHRLHRGPGVDGVFLYHLFNFDVVPKRRQDGRSQFGDVGVSTRDCFGVNGAALFRCKQLLERRFYNGPLLACGGHPNPAPRGRPMHPRGLVERRVRPERDVLLLRRGRDLKPRQGTGVRGVRGPRGKRALVTAADVGVQRGGADGDPVPRRHKVFAGVRASVDTVDRYTLFVGQFKRKLSKRLSGARSPRINVHALL